MSENLEIRDMIRRCSDGAPSAWQDLWEVVEGAAKGPIRSFLWSRQLDPTLCDDIAQDLFLYLSEETARRLGAFRGSSTPEFRLYVRVIALRFASRCVRRHLRTRRLEEKAARDRTRPCDPGPTERQLRLVRQELDGLMGDADRERLRMVQGLPSDPEPDEDVAAAESPSLRTKQRWGKDLFDLYARRVV